MKDSKKKKTIALLKVAYLLLQVNGVKSAYQGVSYELRHNKRFGGAR